MTEGSVAVTATRMNRRWRRQLAGVVAGVAALSAGLVIPIVTAGASTALTSVVQGSTGTTPTVGNPQPAATAKLSTLSSSTVTPTTGDVAEVDGNQVFLLVEDSNEQATDYGIGTSGTLIQGDVYLVAGNGEPGWTSQTSDAATASNPVKATTTIIGKPQVATFDASGNLLIGSNATGEANVVAIPKTTGAAYGFSSMTAGEPYFIAGFTPSTSGNPPAPAIKLPSAITFTSLAASSGIKVGSTQDVVVGTATGVSLLNFSTSQTFYGTSEAASSYTAVAGGGTAACTSGAQNVPATGSSSFAISTSRVFVDGSGNLYVGNASTTGCSWVLPKASGTLTLDGTSTSVTAGTAYKWAGDGTSPKTTAPTNGASAVTTSIGVVNGVTEDPAGNIVFLMGGSTQTTTKINGAYVIANSSGTYYGQNMTAGDFYTIAGSAAHTLGKFHSPDSIGSDSTGNLWITDANTHTLYELTGGPTQPYRAPTATTTSLTTSPSGSVQSGTPVTLKATVSPTAAAGKVQFFDGTTSLGTKTVVSGKATLTTSALPEGTQALKAVFTPTHPATYASSTSSVVHLDVYGAGTTPTTTKPVSTTGGETVTQTVPANGKFKLTVPATARVTLTKPVRSGNTESSTGTLDSVTVTDTRNTVPGWTVSGQVSNFTDSGQSFPGKDLGWTPKVTSQTTGQTATAGATVAPGSTPGLAAASTWANALAGKGLGTATLGAGLHLVIPYITKPGTYKATFTVSAI
jgi:hypothetical protein